MKITLINPPFEEQYSVGASRSIRYVLNITPPLGLAYLAAVLEKNKFIVKIIDCTVGVSFQEVLKSIVNEKPHIIGITSTTSGFESAKFLANRIKELFQKIIVVIGGAHVTATPYETMESRCFDIGVLGEAEETFLELLRHIEVIGLKNLKTIKGIVFRQDGRIIITPKREFIQDLDSLPYPARHLLPPLSRHRPTLASYRRLPLGVTVTSRGCPYQCTFCDRCVFGNIYRQRSTDNVLGATD